MIKVVLLFCISMFMLAFGKDFKLYFLGGQSNMDGYGINTDLPPELQTPLTGVYIFHGNSAPDTVDVDGRGIWDVLQPGHGVRFFSDGKQNRLSDRFGVELTFARRLLEENPGENFAIIKYSRGGSSIDQEAAGRFGCWEPDFYAGNHINQYDHFLATLRYAFEVHDIDRDGEEDILIPTAIIWMQGESDAAFTPAIAQRYEVNLKRLIDLIRAALRMDDLPVVIGQISESGRDEEDGKVWDHLEIVKAVQVSFVNKDKTAILVTSTENYQYSDPWHYDSAGYMDLGIQFAEAVLQFYHRNSIEQ
jgi:hypothetical protein